MIGALDNEGFDEEFFLRLRRKCKKVSSKEEADVLLNILETRIEQKKELTAPEVNIMAQVAIIRTPTFSIDLVNPKIVVKRDKILHFNETCNLFKHSFNTMRYNHIDFTNGMNSELISLSGTSAFLVQHAIEHLNGTLFKSNLVKMAVVRNDGKILSDQRCPCGSGNLFGVCCSLK